MIEGQTDGCKHDRRRERHSAAALSRQDTSKYRFRGGRGRLARGVGGEGGPQAGAAWRSSQAKQVRL